MHILGRTSLRVTQVEWQGSLPKQHVLPGASEGEKTRQRLGAVLWGLGVWVNSRHTRHGPYITFYFVFAVYLPSLRMLQFSSVRFLWFSCKD